MKRTNKPVILEEFGVTSNQASTYSTWFAQIESSGLTGDLIWYVDFIYNVDFTNSPACRQAGSHLSRSASLLLYGVIVC